MMFKLRVLCGLLAVSTCLAVGLSTASGAPDPAPKKPFTYSVTLRAFYFTRTNLVKDKSPNRPAFNSSIRLHGNYRLGDSLWILGATYYGATPFGWNGVNPGFNSKIDNTLPGFALDTLGEAYLQYKGTAVRGKIGNFGLDLPWAPASDSRMKPALYQGLDMQAGFAKNWTLGFDRITRFEHRTSSAFQKHTLLTDMPAGNPAYPIFDTSGAAVGSIGFKNASFAATLYDYEFCDLANLFYLDSKWSLNPNSKLRPFVAAQFVKESQTGSTLIGIINNTTYGLQLGGRLRKNVDLALSFDTAPWRSATLPGVCPNVGLGYFLPSGGTIGCVENGNGTATVYYGGIASPYSDGYATDPLYTTSISQGMADRHSAGDSYKIAASFVSLDQRAKLTLSEAYYFYNNLGGPNNTREFNADVTFYLNHVGTGTYRGLSLRHRYADRRQPTTPDDFKYNRTQLQWDF